ncbi:hypothetical protein ACWEQ7_11090 [Streptomyces sp. NPDC004069]
MAKRSIEVPVDDAAYAALAEEAKRTGLSVPELAGRVLSNDANRRRFLTAAQDFTEAWGPAFDEEFGRAAQPDGVAA